MDALPEFNAAGDLPTGVYRTTIAEVAQRFGTGSAARQTVARRLERLHVLAVATGYVACFVVFGSFVTAKPAPNDVDVFMIMEDTFDAGAVHGEGAVVFDHAAAQAHLGASVFWLRRMAVLGGEEAAIEHWQTKRDGSRRGIVEVVRDDS